LTQAKTVAGWSSKGVIWTRIGKVCIRHGFIQYFRGWMLLRAAFTNASAKQAEDGRTTACRFLTA